MKLIRIFFAAATLALLHGCARNELPRPADLPSFSSLPFVHKIEIQQGNVITQEMVAQLKLGMDKKKVNFVMGSPIILDSFHSNRWDYLYTRQRDGGRLARRQVTLYFDEDQLTRIEGDVKPAAGRLVVDTRQDTTVDVPRVYKESLITKVTHAIPFVGADPAETKPAQTKKGPTTDTPEPLVDTALAEPTLTPIERAALESQGGPGVMAQLKAAIPFTGDAPPTALDARPEAATEAIAGSTEPANTEPPEAGMLSKLKGAPPFSDADVAETEENTDGAKTEEDATPDSLSSDEVAPQAMEDATETDDWESESYVAAPPLAPTGIPLDSELEFEPESGEAEEVLVPEQRTAKKRSFFDRLLGRNKGDEVDASPGNEESRRYRDLSEPEEQ